MTRGRWIPWAFVAFFGVVFAANGALVWAALESWTGLEVGDHYRKGLAYNEALEAQKRQDALGWSVELVAPPGTAGDAPVEVRFTDRDERPLNELSVHAALHRPTHEGFDRDAELAGIGDGRYRAPLAAPLAGQWELRLDARRGRDRFRTRRRLFVR